LLNIGREKNNTREPILEISNIHGIVEATQNSIGISSLPSWMESFINLEEILSETLKKIISSSEYLTKNNNNFLLNVCVNYGGRQEIVKVAKKLALKSSTGEIKPSEVNEELFNSELLTQGIKDPELLIRTSGEKRISNFLLWQLAYSEIYISDVLWPDFNEFEFLKAIIDYQSRNRRFGGIELLPNESYKDSQYSS